MDNGEGGLSTLQLMPLSSHGGPNRSMDSHDIEIPSKRACWEAAHPPSTHEENGGAELRELDLFPREKIALWKSPAIDLANEGGDADVNTDLRLCSTGSEQSMEEWDEKDDEKSWFEEAQGRVAKQSQELILLRGFMLRNQHGAGGSPPLSGEDDDLLGMHEINGGGTLIVPPPKSTFDGCSGGVGGRAEEAGPAHEHSTTMEVEEVRVAFRCRSEASLIPDGWRWRKYGKKGKPPRSYYRCTMTSTCLVRKQVQRCAQDKSILITTYIEWNHDHPLPPAAIPTSSIISETASMFLSGSIPIYGGLVNINIPSPVILHCRPVMATISFSARCPTVTLDLTESPDPTHPLPQFHAPAQPLPPQSALPPLFSRLLYEHCHIASGAMANGEGPHNLDDIASVATDAIMANPKFKVGIVAVVKSIISGGGS